jgi:hypothetical protein
VPSAKKKPAKKPTPAKKKPAAAKMKAAPAKKPAPAKKNPAPAKKPAAPMKDYGARADLGRPIDGFFAQQPAALREILESLRALVDEVVPDAQSSIKWGMPVYEVAGAMTCALRAHSAHVNLVLSGPPDAFADPDGRLEGGGKTGRHLKLTAAAEIPHDAVRGWLRTAAEHARAR